MPYQSGRDFVSHCVRNGLISIPLCSDISTVPVEWVDKYKYRLVQKVQDYDILKPRVRTVQV